MGMKFTNFATSTLAAGITNVATSLTVFAGDGTKFPTLGAGDYFYATLENLAGTREVVKVTARTGDVFGTIVRAQDGTSALAWNTGDKVELRVVSANLNDVPKLDEVNTFSLAQTFTTAPVFTDQVGTRTAAGAAASGANSDITSLTGLTSPITGVGANSKQQSVTATQSGGALTCGLNPTSLDFRSTTLTNGVPNTRTIAAALSLVVPSGGTLGFPTTIAGRIIVAAIDNAGTMELAVQSIAGGTDMSETGVINTTAISASSTASNVWYSTTGRTGVAYRIVGSVDAVNTAGAWGNPTLVQGYGGNALLTTALQKSMVRLNTANGYGSTNVCIRRFTNVVTNQGSDITYVDSATLRI